jgi:hypothetical protein
LSLQHVFRWREHTKQRAHQAEHIREEWDNLCNDESNDPGESDDSSPDSPSGPGIGVPVLGVPEHSEEDETRCHRLKANISMKDGRWSTSRLTQYNAPRKMIVGRAKANAAFLYTGIKEPKAGAVIY